MQTNRRFFEFFALSSTVDMDAWRIKCLSPKHILHEPDKPLQVIENGVNGVVKQFFTKKNLKNGDKQKKCVYLHTVTR